MPEVDPYDLDAILDQIISQAAEESLRITQHAQQEMAEESIKIDEVLEAIKVSVILENYPEHRRGACCLLSGQTQAGRSLHMVCTTSHESLIIITAYEPKPPKWVSSTMRRSQQ